MDRRRWLGAAAGLAACWRTARAHELDDAEAFGLDFPGSSAVRRTMRFRFAEPLAPYPATYLWQAYPRRQAGYYTAFFWGNDDGRGDLRTFYWTASGDPDTYSGAHPYPDARPRGTTHRWEISVDGEDIV
ncbi:MAG TPA: hypothetical protein VFZ93_00775, partial [Albitalea sp.]